MSEKRIVVSRKGHLHYRLPSEHIFLRALVVLWSVSSHCLFWAFFFCFFQLDCIFFFPVVFSKSTNVFLRSRVTVPCYEIALSSSSTCLFISCGHGPLKRNQLVNCWIHTRLELLLLIFELCKKYRWNASTRDWSECSALRQSANLGFGRECQIPWPARQYLRTYVRGRRWWNLC